MPCVCYLVRVHQPNSIMIVSEKLFLARLAVALFAVAAYTLFELYFDDLSASLLAEGTERLGASLQSLDHAVARR